MAAMGEGMARIVRNGARNENILMEMCVFCDAFDCDERWRKQVCSRGCEEEDANVREENKWRL